MPPINIYQFIILVVLALVIFGPERLPQYAQTLARWTRQARDWATDAKVRFKDETGTDFDDVDWQKYDPRQYDPRRIIREALSEEMDGLELTGSAARRPVQPRRGGSKPVDPLELFSAGDAAGETPSHPRPMPSGAPGATEAQGSARRGAVAAGVAGAAATGAGAGSAAESPPEAAGEDQDPLLTQAAPFDSEAT